MPTGSRARGLPFLAALFVIAATAVAIATGSQKADLNEMQSAAAPDYFLWAWRRSEDLSFVNSENIKAAIWTGTIYWKNGDLGVDRRLNPITYPSDMQVVAVARLEIEGLPDAGATIRIAEALQNIGAAFDPIEYQVDFDARRSQRDFYRRLLQELRGMVGPTPLSITALASWCFHDAWIEGLPVDAVVPMIYRMGPEGDYIRRQLASERKFPAAICRGNVGYSSDEPLAPVDNLERVFLFHPLPWNESRMAKMIERTARL